MSTTIAGSKMPTFASQQEGRSKISGSAKPPRPGQKFYRGVFIPQRDDLKPDTGYGQNGSTMPSSVTSVPASDRLSDVSANNPDPVRDALVAGKPAVDDQTRAVSAESYPPSHGATRQQADYADIGKTPLPAKSGASAAPDPKEPN